jgi:hypothetical protein
MIRNIKLDGDQPPNVSASLPEAFDVDMVIRQLEREFGPEIPGDDPIRVYLRAMELMMYVGFGESVRVTQDALTQALAETRTGMDVTAAEKLKVLNDELIRYCERAVEAINEGKNQANSYLITALVEMRSLVNEMKASWSTNVWRERVFGAAIASALLLVGYFAGRLKW